MGELLGQHTAPGVAEHIDLRLAERITQLDDQPRQLGHPHGPTQLGRSAGPGSVEHDQPTALAELPGERPPGLEPGPDTVDKKQRLAGTGLGHPEGRVGEDHVADVRLVAVTGSKRRRRPGQPRR